MAFLSKNNNNEFFSSVDGLDATQASISKSYSGVDFDEESKKFFITQDKILGESLFNVIKKFLVSKSFSVNIENILACLDKTFFSGKGQSQKMMMKRCRLSLIRQLLK